MDLFIIFWSPQKKLSLFTSCLIIYFNVSPFLMLYLNLYICHYFISNKNRSDKEGDKKELVKILFCREQTDISSINKLYRLND